MDDGAVHGAGEVMGAALGVAEVVGTMRGAVEVSEAGDEEAAKV
jgi:hypothetical protein